MTKGDGTGAKRGKQRVVVGNDVIGRGDAGGDQREALGQDIELPISPGVFEQAGEEPPREETVAPGSVLLHGARLDPARQIFEAIRGLVWPKALRHAASVDGRRWLKGESRPPGGLPQHGQVEILDVVADNNVFL